MAETDEQLQLDEDILLYAKDLTISFLDGEKTEVVRHADFYIKKGESVAVVGESGAGKTTLMRVCMGLAGKSAEARGKVFLNFGKEEGFVDICSMTRKDRIKGVFGKKIAMVFQDPSVCLDPVFTVGNQLVEGICLKNKVRKKEGRRIAAELLRQAGMEDGERILKLYPHQLSGGMRQRIAVLLALIPEPELLICDEFSSSLDPLAKKQIYSLVEKERKKRPMAVAYITHDLELAAERAEYIHVMYHGKMVEKGSAVQVFQNPRDDYTKKLVSAARKKGAGEGRRSGEKEKNRPLLEVKGLSRSFAVEYPKKGVTAVRAVDNISFSIYPGEIYGLIGGSGAGKSTVARMIMDICQPDQGEILLGDREYSGKLSKAERKELYSKVQMVFQDPAACLNPSRRVMDIVAQAIDIQEGKIGKDERKKRVRQMLEAVGLSEDVLFRFPGQLSGGQRQRVEIARTMIVHPKLVVVDEGVSALDPVLQLQVGDLLMDIRDKMGTAVLFISHDLPVVRRICDRVGLMHQGSLVEECETETFFSNPSSQYAREFLMSGSDQEDAR